MKRAATSLEKTLAKEMETRMVCARLPQDHRLMRAVRSLLLITAAVAASSARAEDAAGVNDFLDTIGFCTHWSYPDTPYGSAYEEAKRRLVELGVHHVRDGFNDRIADLGKAGIRTTLVVDADRTPEQIVEAVKQINAGGPYIDAIEGPNEPDLFWKGGSTFAAKSYKGMGAAKGEDSIIEGVIAFQKDLYAAIKGDPATAGLVVIGPSLGKTYGYDKGSPYRKGTLSAYVDWGNFHPYPGGNPFSLPFPYAGVEKYIWHGGQPSANMDEFPYAFDIYAPPFAPKPMAATETGYSTYTDGTSEEAQAKYLPRLFCEYFRKGIKRTTAYEFIDEFADPNNREANFGVLRHDLSPKPAFVALKNLIGLLRAARASGSAEKPGALEFSLEAHPSGEYRRTQYVHHILLGADAGSFCLLLWHEIALDDTSQKPFHALPHAPGIPVTLTFTAPVKTIAIYEPNESTQPVKSVADTQKIDLLAPDEVMLIRTVP